LNIETSETCQNSTGESASDQFRDHSSIKGVLQNQFL